MSHGCTANGVDIVIIIKTPTMDPTQLTWEDRGGRACMCGQV